MTQIIAALFVLENGPYSKLKNIDLWGINRDARKYKGPFKVIAHPPCMRWGRYWGGGPMLAKTPNQKILGDDDNCFAHALWAVRAFGGVFEHPEASHAWPWFGLAKPPRSGGWIKADNYGGMTCCVAQGHYGHKAQKLTWLYACKVKTPKLKWGLSPNKILLDQGFHSKKERAHSTKTEICQRLSKLQRETTPIKFRNLLIKIARNEK